MIVPGLRFPHYVTLSSTTAVSSCCSCEHVHTDAIYKRRSHGPIDVAEWVPVLVKAFVTLGFARMVDGCRRRAYRVFLCRRFLSLSNLDLIASIVPIFNSCIQFKKYKVSSRLD
jgi:hypothetical protein